MRRNRNSNPSSGTQSGDESQAMLNTIWTLKDSSSPGNLERKEQSVDERFLISKFTKNL